MKIKIGSYILGDWEGFGNAESARYWNFYRTITTNAGTTDSNSYFGLIVNSYDDFQEDLAMCTWKVAGISKLRFLETEYYKINKEVRRYKFHEIPSAKEDVDKFLIKMSKLLLFI